jgi:thiol-disulfide isomerase/thioredoxin
MRVYLLLFIFFLSAKFVGQNRSFEDTCNIKFYDVEGKEMKLSSLKGKVVYIDFWASWCKGCYVFFDSAVTLKKKFTKKQLKQIVFLYVSIDSDGHAWKKAMSGLKVEGMHWLSPGNDPNFAGKCFRITGLARFMILNKKGEIASWIARTTWEPELYGDLVRLIEEK